MSLPGGAQGRGDRERRGRRRSLRQVEAHLSERDRAILTDLGKFRLLTGRHIERLHFADGSPLTAARKSRSTLQRLYAQKLISRLDRRIGGIRAGSSGYIYALTASGQRIASRHGPAGGSRLRRHWEPSRLFTEHLLAISELYVGLVEADRAGAIELLDFQAEPACWRSWHGHGGEVRYVKPDALVQLAVGEVEAACFVEVDRGTESLSVIRRKSQAYVDYWHTGVEQARHELFPSVLWLTTDARRAEQIVDELARLDPETWKLFRVDQLARGIDAVTNTINQP